ncbi:MAG: glycosyltransferase [Terracidiphilus sp.]|jgi:glycosyltransferase involved in cell wall biosynthesis
MKALWLTNTLMPDAARHIGQDVPRGSGWWMSSLLDRLKQRRDVELAVVTAWGAGAKSDCRFTHDKVTYFVTKTPARQVLFSRLGFDAAWHPSRRQLVEFASIVNEWNPDIVHVHGTEMDYGLIKSRGLVAKPMAVSIQGLMAPCARKAFGDLLPEELYGTIRGLVRPLRHCLKQSRWFRCRIPLEEEILKSADMVFGRTEFDKAWAWAYNSSVIYRHVNELMRSEFLDAAPWSLQSCQKHRIFCTSGNQPLKGLHVLVEAVHRLRQIYQDIELNVASNGFVPHFQSDYARFVKRQIEKWKLAGVVTFLGYLDANGLIEQLKQANCYVTPSFIENGCNALQEAMLVGTPCVATLSGGLLTTIDPGTTGMAFPVGDAALLAWQIAKIFDNDSLASQLGRQARVVARERHNPARVEEQLLNAYNELATL